MKYVIKRGSKYWPSKEMKKIAWVSDSKIYSKAEKNPVCFWEKLAEEGISWNKKWTKGYQEKIPYFEWFKGGKLNLCFNALDRHLDKKDKIALIWVPEPTNENPVKLSYGQLQEQVEKFANVLKSLGVKKGDVVSIYLPLIPEIVIAMLACLRIGAVHSIVFSAFSSDALKARIQDCESKVLITSDGYYRRGEKENLLQKVKGAIKKTSIKKIIVVSRLNKKKEYSGKFLKFEKLMKNAKLKCSPEFVESKNPSFILYTSGTTGKPKGIVHDTGGYAVQAYWTTKWIFDLKEKDIMWCTADVGWITGHTYGVYGPLLNGSTTLIYEGSPDFPKPDRWWKIIDEFKVNIFYTAPTAIRMFMKFGDSWINKYSFSSLKLLGSVGEPIDEKSWRWYFKKIGKSRCPIIDTWWQTETGGVLINALPGIGPFIPTIAGKSFPGVRHEILNRKGKKTKKGILVQRSPFAPGMLHGVWKDHKKYVKTYWSSFKKKYDTSDGALLKNNLFRITGRVDDVMKVAGHRLSTAEIENSFNLNHYVNESAVVPVSDSIKGQVPVAFIVLKKRIPSKVLENKIKKHIDKTIGPIARPKKVYFVEDLPKTRSGKIMRRILKNILNNEKIEGTMTLINPECIEEIKEVVTQEENQKK